MLNNAVQDIRIAYNCYAHITRSTPMIYLLLANKTKDGFDMANLFFKFDGHFRTTAEMKELLPFYQMGRLCQVMLTILSFINNELRNYNIFVTINTQITSIPY